MSRSLVSIEARVSVVERVAEGLEATVRDGATVVPINSPEAIVEAREIAHAIARRVGFSGSDAVVFAATIAKVARGLCACTTRGEIVLAVRSQGLKQGLEVVAQTDGLAIHRSGDGEDKFKLGRLRRKLLAAEAVMDEYEVAPGPCLETTVTMRKWLGRREEAQTPRVG